MPPGLPSLPAHQIMKVGFPPDGLQKTVSTIGPDSAVVSRKTVCAETRNSQPISVRFHLSSPARCSCNPFRICKSSFLPRPSGNVRWPAPRSVGVKSRSQALPQFEPVPPQKADIRVAHRRVCYGRTVDVAYSITSSARASSVGGTSRPSPFAVLRLITNSYLVGACTGRSAGRSPLRMRFT